MGFLFRLEAMLFPHTYPFFFSVVDKSDDSNLVKLIEDEGIASQLHEYFIFAARMKEYYPLDLALVLGLRLSGIFPERPNTRTTSLSSRARRPRSQKSAEF